MKKLHLSLLFTLAVLTASSQKVYFIYIQAESEQPFFVKMNEKVNSSTGSGYIILSKLVDSTYSFSIGFPQNKWPEQNFSVAMNKKDHGYLLKNFGEKGWGLFDLQTLVVQMAVGGKASIDIKPRVENKDVSAFTEILSRAADDPSLKDKPVVVAKVEEKKADPVIQAVVKTETPQTEIKDPVVSKPVEAELAVVKKEETKPEVKEPFASKPAEVTDVAVVKKEEPKPEVKEPVPTKPAEVTDPVVAKKDEIKTEDKITAKADETVETAVATKQESQPVIKEPVITRPVEVNDAVVMKKEEPATDAKTENTESYKVSKVKKWSESSTTEGFGLVFIDGYDNGTNDTIRLVIPNPNPAVKISREEPKDDKQFIKTSELPGKDVIPVVEEKKTVTETPKDAVVTASDQAVKETATNEEKIAVVEAPKDAVVEKAVLVNSCKEVASGDDFVKLRKRMAAAETDDGMIAEAKKYYKVKCFSTWQLKNLGVLFLTDEGKYKFFDASYPFVTDMKTFPTLQAELKDEYYTGRFKAMLRN